MTEETHPILVVGAGFAGVQAALAARRAGQGRAAVTLLAPQPVLAVRPRLYEADPASMAFDLRPTLRTAGVAFRAGEAAGVDAKASRLGLIDGTSVAFDRLVIATGSRMATPAIPGVEHAFDIDTVEQAVRFELRLREVAALPEPAIVVIGGGFTGIELALELRPRVRQMFDAETAGRLQVHVVDRAAEIGHGLGPHARPAIEAALATDGVKLHLNESVVRIDERSVHLSGGLRLRSDAAVLCVGLQAAPFVRSLPFERAADGRLVVDAHLRAAPAGRVFAAGDAALAEAAPGRPTLLSCQHALGMGPIAGENAVRDLLGLPLLRYEQRHYVTYLDLGDAGAVATEGWEREPRFVGSEAKAIKRRVNTKWIYPRLATSRESANAAHGATTRESASDGAKAPSAGMR